MRYIRKWSNIQPHKSNGELVPANMWMNPESIKHWEGSQAREAGNLTIPFVRDVKIRPIHGDGQGPWGKGEMGIGRVLFGEHEKGGELDSADEHTPPEHTRNH